jgi:hypothetical protein
MLADAAGYTERIVQVVADDDPAVRRAVIRGSFHELLLGLVVPKPGQMVLSSAGVPRLHLRISRVSAFVDVVLLAEDEKRELGHWVIRGARWSPLP